VSQQEALVSTERAAIPPLEITLRQNIAALAVLVGRAPANFTVGGGVLTQIAIPRVTPGMPSELLNQRPDIRQAEALLAYSNFSVEAARAAFSRLTQREQVIVLAGAAGAVVIVLLLIGLLVSSAIDSAEHRVKVKGDQLAQVLALQGEYKAREAQRQARLREIGRSTTRLVSLVEDVARQTGVDIGQLKPEDGEANAQGFSESSVDLRATALSADKLQDFLSRLETAPGVIIIRRLKVTRPFRKDTVDVELTVTTYRSKAG
jgi:hypothetical protein